MSLAWPTFQLFCRSPWHVRRISLPNIRYVCIQNYIGTQVEDLSIIKFFNPTPSRKTASDRSMRWSWRCSYLRCFCDFSTRRFMLSLAFLLFPCSDAFSVILSIMITLLGQGRESCSVCFSCICWFVFI